MNKAFMREPDSHAEYCPRCGSAGETVAEPVLQQHVRPEKVRSLAVPANFCPAPQCAVVYFDSFERVLLAEDLLAPVYPKDPHAPICACFGLTCDDIEQDIREGVTTRTKAAVLKAQSAAAQCAQKSANGQSCVAYVQKYYLQCLNRRQSD